MQRKIFIVSILVAALFFVVKNFPAENTEAQIAPEFEPATYTMEHIMGVWTDGYLNGPAQGAMSTIKKMDMDSDGNIFFVDMRNVIGHRVRVLTKEGRVYNIAGNGVQGFKDGPADSAMFNFGGSGYRFSDISLDSRGNIFVGDGHNNRIRIISKKADGLWWVDTYSGGGAVSLRVGETGRSEDLKLGNPVVVTVDSYDNVWTADAACIYKFTPGGDAYCFENPDIKPSNMAADKAGNIYMQIRQNSNTTYWKVKQDGTTERVAGFANDTELNNYLTQIGETKSTFVDGPTSLESFFWSHSEIAVTDDGSIIYGGNGDEVVMRRVYKDGQSRSLYKDGWHKETVNRNEGWHIGGPTAIDSQGRIYIVPGNPPEFLRLRRLVPTP